LSLNFYKITMKLSVIIPVYNEKDTVLTVLEKVSDVPVEKEIIVVDDGSTDGTGDILKQLQTAKSNKDLPIKIILKEKNEGKGAAIRHSLKEVTGDVLIIQDADGEYNPSDYTELFVPIREGKADVVYGSRFLSKNNKFLPLSYIANRFLTALVNLLFKCRLTDMETCYKMFRKDIIDSIHLESSGFEIEVELTCKILKKKVRIQEIPIYYKARKSRHGKKIGFKDGLKAIISILRYRIVL
jgi:glycosyltransferase involved in cell wall biosynthesis